MRPIQPTLSIAQASSKANSRLYIKGMDGVDTPIPTLRESMLNRLFLLWVVFGVSVLYVAWMMFKDFFPQTMTVNMGVDGCGLDTFMSQHGLDGT